MSLCGPHGCAVFFCCFFDAFLLKNGAKSTRIVSESGEKWYFVSESGNFNMFMGEYNHTIDAKGRLTIPSKFREQLGDGFIVTKGLDGCLFVFDKGEWEKFEEKLTTLPMTSSEARTFVRFFIAGAAFVEVDKMGRILLPPSLRTHAGISKDAVLLGVASRIEIWSKERWDACDLSDMDDIASKMEELGLRI